MRSPRKEKILITVKTYPNLSTKYDELVCTAGITDKGKWIRIYPVPFRKLKWEKQYKKYQWIEWKVIKNAKDFRPESYSPTDRGKDLFLGETVKNWEERKKIIFDDMKVRVYKNMEKLIKEAQSDQNHTSLAIFKPKKILDFKFENQEREWDQEKLKKIKEQLKQLSLDGSNKPHKIFDNVKKLPYKFKDDSSKTSTLMIEDWEIGALYWNCLKRVNKENSLSQKEKEEQAIEKVKQKYYNQFLKKDLYFFLGTIFEFHKIGRNPFIIVGVFYPPFQDKEKQLSLGGNNGTA